MVEPTSEPQRAAAPTGRVLAVVAAALVGIIVLVLAVRSGGDDTAGHGDRAATTSTAPAGDPATTATTGDASPTSSPVGTTEPQPGPSTDAVTEEAARAVLDALLVRSTEAVNGGSEADEIAGGTVLSALEATRAEFENQGWEQVGVPSVEDVTVVGQDPDATPPTVTVEACIDSSAVRIVDATGQDLRNEATPDRSRNRYTLSLVDGTWLVTDQTFPDDPDC